jgi:hypothetical protein
MDKDFDYTVFAKTVEEQTEILNEISILNQSDVDHTFQIKWHGVQIIDAQGCYSKINMRSGQGALEFFLKGDKYHVETIGRSI